MWRAVKKKRDLSDQLSWALAVQDCPGKNNLGSGKAGGGGGEIYKLPSTSFPRKFLLLPPLFLPHRRPVVQKDQFVAEISRPPANLRHFSRKKKVRRATKIFPLFLLGTSSLRFAQTLPLNKRISLHLELGKIGDFLASSARPLAIYCCPIVFLSPWGGRGSSTDSI